MSGKQQDATKAAATKLELEDQAVTKRDCIEILVVGSREVCRGVDLAITPYPAHAAPARAVIP